jgi:hypothetical protein
MAMSKMATTLNLACPIEIIKIKKQKFNEF